MSSVINNKYFLKKKKKTSLTNVLYMQADVCHAYQILKKGGLKDENIIIFMYDDIAFNPENPRPGVIINKPNGRDVYKGVPKVKFFFFLYE